MAGIVEAFADLCFQVFAACSKSAQPMEAREDELIARAQGWVLTAAKSGPRIQFWDAAHHPECPTCSRAVSQDQRPAAWPKLDLWLINLSPVNILYKPPFGEMAGKD